MPYFSSFCERVVTFCGHVELNMGNNIVKIGIYFATSLLWLYCYYTPKLHQAAERNSLASPPIRRWLKYLCTLQIVHHHTNRPRRQYCTIFEQYPRCSSKYLFTF